LFPANYCKYYPGITFCGVKKFPPEKGRPRNKKNLHELLNNLDFIVKLFLVLLTIETFVCAA